MGAGLLNSIAGREQAKCSLGKAGVFVYSGWCFQNVKEFRQLLTAEINSELNLNNAGGKASNCHNFRRKSK
jgi:hypothetical protein